MPPINISPSDVSGIEDKVVIVTGGSSGIGLATSKFMISQGAYVVIADLQPPPENEFSPADKLLFSRCNASEWDSVLATFEKALEWRNRIDVLVANAGIGEIEDIFVDRIDPATGKLQVPSHSVLQVNLMGVMNCVKVAIHHMRKQSNGGSIVMTTSSAGYMAERCLPAYSTSKHGLVGFMRSLRPNAPKFNIKINCIAPYMTESKLMHDDLRNKLGNLGVPINPAINVALAIGYMVTKELNGKTILSGANEFYEIEEDLTALETEYMGNIGSHIRTTQGAELFVSESGL